VPALSWFGIFGAQITGAGVEERDTHF